MSEVDKYQRRIDRERAARKEAERLLEEKSAALYEKNLELFSLSESLEKLVAQRTAQMQKARDDALKALKVKTDFIANMSHELRTPMNGVLGVLSILQNEKLSEDQHELLDVAESSGRHLLEVINDILDFSKIEANKISIELAPLEIRPYLKSVIAPFVLQAKQKQIALSYHIDEDVPAGLITDKLRLTQIATNLLSNAIKFTHDGEVKLTFTSKGEGMYQMSVSDTGIGISAENLDLVFAAFEQADTSITREFGGTGLGMNITKRLVDMFEGKIHITSELGKGSTFFVDIAMESCELDVPKTDSVTMLAEHAKGQKILLVEDHKVNQMVAKRLLENWEFSVSLAENGAQALERVQKEDFDCILMDLQMPIMGGIEATKKIRKDELISKTTPIIAMTAHSSPEHIKECLQAGMQAHVSKPLDKAHLLEILELHLAANLIEQQSNVDRPDILLRHVALDEALERVGGDWPMLCQLMTRFFEEFKDFNTIFSQAKADGMTEIALPILHKLKGSGGNLGLNTLSQLAAQYEARLNDSGQWPNEHEIQQMSQLLHDTHNDLQKEIEKLDTKDESEKISVDESEVLAQISLIEETLKQDVFAAEAALKVLLNYDLHGPIQQSLIEAERAMQSFDTAGVANALSHARQQMD